jgi:uncharacterized DUF497 family protein
VSLVFEWDNVKAKANKRKHRVSFEEAATAFGDPLSITIRDPDHSAREKRFVLVGRTHKGKTAVVVHTELRNGIRIISARRASRREVRAYEEE